MLDLVLYRQASSEAGEWKIYRHSGFANGRWRLIFSSRDEGKADLRYEALYERWKQGGIRMVDPEGQVIRHAFAPPLRWVFPERAARPR